MTRRGDIPWPRIKAVTFDVGGTLIEPWPSVGQVYAAVAAGHGVRVEAEALTRGFVRAWQGRKGFGYTREDWYGVVREAFGERAGELPEGFFPAVYERFAEPDVWRVFEDVRPVLAALRERGVRMGVISNWDDRLQPLLRALELHECFDVVVVSYAAGVTKPSPAIFKAALRGLRLEAHEVLHLGDSEREDVAGARGAGLHALKVERNRSGGDLRELPGLLQRAD